MAARKRKCVRWGKAIQRHGPAKKVCRKYGPPSAKAATKKRRKGGRKRTGWCVHKGKEVVSCHRTKRVASKRAVAVRKTCKSKVSVRRKKAA